jgi:hypothetical protein
VSDQRKRGGVVGEGEVSEEVTGGAPGGASDE